MAGHDHAEDLGLERIVFLSDGVFAIAMTLLVLDVRLPELPAGADGDAITAALVDAIPRLFAYALSFAILALFWTAHWRRFKQIRRGSVGLASVNLLLLACVALIPFPTSVMGTHPGRTPSVVLYAVTLSAAGLAGVLTWWYAQRAGLLYPDAPRDLRESGTLRAIVLPGVMLASLALLPVLGPGLVPLTWTLILPFVLLARPRRERGPAAPGTASGTPPAVAPEPEES